MTQARHAVHDGAHAADTAFQTRTEAYDAIAEYIDHYESAKRPHSAAQSLSPTKFELATARQRAA